MHIIIIIIVIIIALWLSTCLNLRECKMGLTDSP